MTSEDDNYTVEEEIESNWLFMIEELNGDEIEQREPQAQARGRPSVDDNTNIHDLTERDDSHEIVDEYDSDWVFNIAGDENDDKFVEDDDMSVEHDEICAVNEHDGIYISWDSGADEHVAPEWFGTAHMNKTSVNLRDINGSGLKCVGSRNVDTIIKTKSDKNIKLANRYNIGEKITKPVCSMGKAYRQGFKTVTDPKGESYFEKDGVKVPLVLRRNSFYFKADVIGAVTKKKKNHRQRPARGDQNQHREVQPAVQEVAE